MKHDQFKHIKLHQNEILSHSVIVFKTLTDTRHEIARMNQN